MGETAPIVISVPSLLNRDRGHAFTASGFGLRSRSMCTAELVLHYLPYLFAIRVSRVHRVLGSCGWWRSELDDAIVQLEQKGIVARVRIRGRDGVLEWRRAP